MTMEAEDIVLENAQDPSGQDKSNNDNGGSEQDSDEEFDESLLDGYVTDDNRVRGAWQPRRICAYQHGLLYSRSLRKLSTGSVQQT